MTNLVGLEIKEFDNRCNEEIGLRIQNKRIERNTFNYVRKKC